MAKPKTAAAAIAAAIAQAIPPVLEPAPPEVIPDNDPEGRQAGDPNDTITLPPELLAEHKPTFTILTTESELTEAEVSKLTASTIERRPDVATDNLPQPPTVSMQTELEMQTGARKLAEFAEQFPHRLLETPPAPPRAPFVEREPQGGPVPAQPPTITEATLMEQQAGREAVAKREAEYARNRQITIADAARRARAGGAADPGDLDYTA